MGRFQTGLMDGVGPVPDRTSDAPRWVQAVGDAVVSRVESIATDRADIPPFQQWVERRAGQATSFSDYVTEASQKMAAPFVEVVFLIALLLMGYVLWSLTPAVLAGHNPEWETQPGRRESTSRKLGRLASKGLGGIWAGQVILAICLLATQALFVYRGVRIREIRAMGEGSKPQSLEMVLVDQFLGVRPNRGTQEPPVEVPNRLPPDDRRQIHQAERQFQENGSEERREIREMVDIIVQPSGDAATPGKRVLETSAEPNPSTEREETAVGPVSKLTDSVLTEAMFFNLGPVTVGLLVGLPIIYVIFSGSLTPLVVSVRAILDYLRPGATGASSPAHSLNRYASLLRYLVRWRDERESHVRYVRVVILTHGQGGILTTDLLRLLNQGTVAQDNGLELLREDPADVMAVPVRLFTMGNPLRQIYANNFPDLYDWALEPAVSQQCRGLQAWVNVYQSGDVFGRALWRPARDPDEFRPDAIFPLAAEANPERFREYCLGPGGHLNYWDECSPQAIADLDRLLAEDYRPALRLFLSYRREDTKQMVSFLHQGLEERFGNGSVFVDIDRIEAGGNFHQRIAESLAQCHAILVVIGSRWLPLSEWVQKEIAAAMKQGTFILPILVDGAIMPAKGELPPEIQPITEINAARLESGPDFDLHLRRIGDRIYQEAGAGGGEAVAKVKGNVEVGTG
jgi:hypothetical protein